jgi:hypothetical protein
VFGISVAEEVFYLLMGICRRTFYISPFGHGLLPSLKAPWLGEAVRHTFLQNALFVKSRSMSALPPKADILGGGLNVR